MKSEFEKQNNIRFSKNGIKDFITKTLNDENPETMSQWESKFKMPMKLNLFLKKGGSSFSSEVPFVRTESTFNQKYKMEKLIKCVSTNKNTLFQIFPFRSI